MYEEAGRGGRREEEYADKEEQEEEEEDEEKEEDAIQRRCPREHLSFFEDVPSEIAFFRHSVEYIRNSACAILGGCLRRNVCFC